MKTSRIVCACKNLSFDLILERLFIVKGENAERNGPNTKIEEA